MNSPKKMYGLLHSASGEAIVREPRMVKVGIGLPAGKAIHAYIDAEGKWAIQVANEVKRFESMIEAKKYYRASKAQAPDRRYPQRLPYFTFTRISPDGTFEPVWDVIAAHGPLPTEIDIVFTKDQPFQYAYQYWTAAEKKCEGDGLNAERVVTLADTDQEKQWAEEAKKNGMKTYGIMNGCWTKGCPYAQGQNGKPSPCRPHGRLFFQMVKAPVLGGTAEFLTTGFRSISQIFSCIQTFREFTGRGEAEDGFVAGIPLVMVLRPYRTSHDGKPATQFGVSIEFRAENVIELKRKLVQHGVDYRLADVEPLKALNAAPIEARPGEEDLEPPAEIAAAMAAEFHPEQQAPEGEETFTDPENQTSEPSVAMPKRMSEKTQETQQPTVEQVVVPDGAEQQPEGEESAGQQLIDALWSEPEQTKEPEIPLPPTPPPVEPPKSAATNGNAKKWEKLLEASRAKGISDRSLHEAMGRMGFEMASEISDKGFSDLHKWVADQKARAAQPTQPKLA